ncbi:MAG TPA: prenyltransferase/squalene oxidase repeat-containing protein, partial [Gemmataceae bacterium]|nr:prenyltransferase/squalene oxidase repeat-containing protein [Gemmataceae bacterium]
MNGSPLHRREALVRLGQLSLGALAAPGLLAAGRTARAEEIPEKYERAIEKGLRWLAKQQHRDGHFDAQGGQYPMAMTGLAGMCFLMQGSTTREGKYADNIRRAMDWFIGRSQPNGLLCNPNHPGEAGRYMYGHGYGLLFLASCHGEEDEPERRKKLEDVLTRAVKFTCNAQATCGGWNYVSSKDSGDGHEGSVTAVQVQSLRAARNAGIVVPLETIKKCHDYLKKATDSQGAVMYQLGGGSGSPALTAQALACLFAAGDYKDDLVKRWLKYCQRAMPLERGGGGLQRFGHYEYTHYYYSQVAYMLGEDGWDKLFGSGDRNKLTWKKYKAAM